MQQEIMVLIVVRTTYNFYVLLTVHLRKILVISQFNAQILVL